MTCTKQTYSHSARDEQHLKKLVRQSLEMTNETRIYRRKQQLDKNQFFEQEKGLLYGYS